MTTEHDGPLGPSPAMADGLRVATENATRLWRLGAEALAAQVAAMERLRPPGPVPGVEQYFDLLRQATEVNRQLAAQWADAVLSMTALLVPGAPMGLSESAAPDRDGSDRATSGPHAGDPAPASAEAASFSAPSRPVTDADGGPASAGSTAAPADAGDVPDAQPAAAVMVPDPVAPVIAAAEGVPGVAAGRSADLVPAPPTAVATTDPGVVVTAESAVLPATTDGPPPAKRRRRAPARTAAAAAASPATDGSDDPRAAYVRMGKAAISARLAERGLPRSGTLAQLVNRLVEAETADRSGATDPGTHPDSA